jgi:hypothetical protein
MPLKLLHPFEVVEEMTFQDIVLSRGDGTARNKESRHPWFCRYGMLSKPCFEVNSEGLVAQKWQNQWFWWWWNW